MSDADREARMKTALDEARARMAEIEKNRHHTEQTLGGAAKAFTTGVRQGTEGLAGSYGDAPGIAGGAAAGTARALGAEDLTAAKLGSQIETGAKFIMDPRAKIEALARLFGMSDQTGELPTGIPGSQDIHQGVSQLADYAGVGDTGREWTEHIPSGGFERLAQTTGEMTPNLAFTGPKAVMSAVVAPALGAELGGYAGEAVGYPNAGRFIGGMGASMLPGGATRMLTGAPISGERERLVRLLGDEGIDLTAGQASGSKPLQYAEVGPYETKAAGIGEQQAGQYNQAALQRAGIPGDILSPAAVRQARDDFGVQYEHAIQRIGGLPIDQDALNHLTTLTDDYHRIMAQPSNAPSVVNAFADKIMHAGAANNGVIPADVFQQIRSDISRTLRTIGDGDPTLTHTLEDMQDVLYGSIERNAPPGAADAFRDLNNRYRNFMILSKAMRGAGISTAEGNLTPQKVRGAVQAANPNDYIAGQGDLADLARAGEVAMKPLPQTGTAPRALTFGFPAAIAGEAFRNMTEGNLGQAMGTVAAGTAASLLPRAISSLLTAGPVREALLRRILGDQAHQNPMATALAGRQIENESSFGGPR